MQSRHPHKSVLISGASFAGLTAAFWMNQLGYSVTVVEIAKGLKLGGSPVDIKGRTVDIVQRMALLERIQERSLKPKGIDFLNDQGISVSRMPPVSSENSNPEYEVERDVLLHMLFDEVKNDVEFLFDESIAQIEESANEVSVAFRTGEQRTFSLLLGCDGNHSAVRRICFGEESQYSLFLHNYFAITIANELLILSDTAQMYNVPGKVIMLNAYNGKTDIIFGFYSAHEIQYDYRNSVEQRQIIRERFTGEGWKTEGLLEKLDRSENFYFDKMSQIKMPRWSKGRVALAGDAAYCASPAAGMGGSLAIVGATALADALQLYPDDFQSAFQKYDRSLRPFVEEVQKNAVDFGLQMFIPRSEEALFKRNAQFNG